MFSFQLSTASLGVDPGKPGSLESVNTGLENALRSQKHKGPVLEARDYASDKYV